MMDILTEKATKTVSLKRWCVHKIGTGQLGVLCSFKEEAEDLLRNLKSDLIRMAPEEKAKYVVVEVEVKFQES